MSAFNKRPAYSVNRATPRIAAVLHGTSLIRTNNTAVYPQIAAPKYSDHWTVIRAQRLRTNSRMGARTQAVIGVASA